MPPEKIDIENMTITELKALSYDFIIQKDQIQQNLNMIAAEIALKMKANAGEATHQ